MDTMRTNPDNYKWGIFYYNPMDSRTILPKRNKWFGWTLNFARPKAYLVLLAIIAFAVLMGLLEE